MVAVLALAVSIVAFWLAFLGLVFRRWMLWTFICWRGRLCANLNIDNLDTAIPAGSVAGVDYECGACGTHYRTTVIVGENGAYTVSDRERVHA